MPGSCQWLHWQSAGEPGCERHSYSDALDLGAIPVQVQVQVLVPVNVH